MRGKGLRTQDQRDLRSRSPECLLRDGKREGPIAAPVVARVVPEGAHPTPIDATAQPEDARDTAGINNRLMKNGDVVDAPALQLLVGNGFPKEKGQFTTKVVGFPVIALATLPEVSRGAFGVGGELFLTEHQSDGVLLPRLEAVLVVVVGTSEDVASPFGGFGTSPLETDQPLFSRQTEAGDGDEDTAELISPEKRPEANHFVELIVGWNDSLFDGLH